MVYAKYWKGKKFTEEHRRKISENHADMSGKNNPFYGKHHTTEAKKRVSETHLGNIPINKGKKGLQHHTKEAKRRMSEAHKGKCFIPKETLERMGKECSIRMSGRKISEETKEKMSKSHKGLNTWTKTRFGARTSNWKGGTTQLNDLLRATSKMKIWRELIFMRDNFICQNPKCSFCSNIVGVKLNAHHKKQVKDILKENNIKTTQEALNCKELWAVDNGITYCEEYHLKTEMHKRAKNKIHQEVEI